MCGVTRRCSLFYITPPMAKRKFTMEEDERVGFRFHRTHPDQLRDTVVDLPCPTSLPPSVLHGAGSTPRYSALACPSVLADYFPSVPILRPVPSTAGLVMGHSERYDFASTG